MIVALPGYPRPCCACYEGLMRLHLSGNLRILLFAPFNFQIRYLSKASATESIANCDPSFNSTAHLGKP